MKYVSKMDEVKELQQENLIIQVSFNNKSGKKYVSKQQIIRKTLAINYDKQIIINGHEQLSSSWSLTEHRWSL